MLKREKIVFITGTDTGVGKTLLAALLLHRLRRQGVHALAMKPFCSGGLGDVRLLQSLQPGELTDREMNPFYFDAPVAPLVAAAGRRAIHLRAVLKKIQAVESKCERLLIEGSGGLMVPLGPRFTVADLITNLRCRVIIAARNQLGTINHTLLTVAALEQAGIKKNALQIVLMGTKKPDLSSQTNAAVLQKLLHPTPLFSLPYLRLRASTAAVIRHTSQTQRLRLPHV